MLHYVGDASDIKNIILVGGGRSSSGRQSRKHFPNIGFTN